MEYRNFRLKILLRVLIIFLTLFILVLALTGKENYVTAAVFLFLLIVELIELFNFINRINREVEQFVNAIRNKDYSLNFNPEQTGKTFRSLRNSLGIVMNDIESARKNELMQTQYLQMLIDNIDSGIMVIGPELRVNMQNKTISRLFKRSIDLDYLNDHHYELAEFARSGKAGDKKLYITSLNEKRHQFTVRKTVFRLDKEEYHLITLQDIHSELDNKEMDSWYKLIRVLTHEIMNSVTPVNSLSGAILEELKTMNAKEPREDFEDVILSAQTIFERSRDLMKFITDYKKLTRTYNPEFKNINAKSLLLELSKLFEREFEKEEIDYSIEYPEEQVTIKADKEMITRVLINLINNSIDALKNNELKKMRIIVKISESSQSIEVVDNGEGIPTENMEEIFIPFFTTKEKGSGIGLPLSKQIMKLHRGSIYVRSKPGEGTAVSLVFPDSRA